MSTRRESRISSSQPLLATPAAASRLWERELAGSSGNSSGGGATGRGIIQTTGISPTRLRYQELHDSVLSAARDAARVAISGDGPADIGGSDLAAAARRLAACTSLLSSQMQRADLRLEQRDGFI